MTLEAIVRWSYSLLDITLKATDAVITFENKQVSEK